MNITLYGFDVLIERVKKFPQATKEGIFDWSIINPDIKEGPHSFVERAIEASYEKCDDEEIVRLYNNQINLIFTVKFDPDDFKFKQIVKDFKRLEKLFNTLIYYMQMFVSVTQFRVDLFNFAEQNNYDVIDCAFSNQTFDNNLKNYIDLRYSHIWNIARRISNADMYKRAPEESMEDGQKYEQINKYTAPDVLKQLVVNLAKDDFYTLRLEGFELFPKSPLYSPVMYIQVTAVKDQKKNTLTILKKHLHKAFSTFTDAQRKEMNYLLKYQTAVYVVFSEDVEMPACDTNNPDKIMYEWIFDKNPYTFKFYILTSDYLQFRNNLASSNPIKYPYYKRDATIAACRMDDFYNNIKSELDKIYWRFKAV